jgi:membrane-associated HD superfamily phosphohydrolase
MITSPAMYPNYHANVKILYFYVMILLLFVIYIVQVNFLSQILLAKKGDGPKIAKRLVDVYIALFKVSMHFSCSLVCFGLISNLPCHLRVYCLFTVI